MKKNKSNFLEDFYQGGIPLIVLAMGLVVVVMLGKHCVSQTARGMFGNKTAFEEGELVPDYPVKVVDMESYKSLADLVEEKPALLIFTQPGCRYCEMQIGGLYDDIKTDDPFAVYVVSMDSEKVIQRKKQSGSLPFPVIMDQSHYLTTSFKAFSFPTAALIGQGRRFIFQDTGYNERLRSTVLGNLGTRKK